ncbi:DUF6979 family protein [Halomonas sp. HNIBRBA4712]|uniref:DUF6979 family protein n=1 Tax=Halomonas sp. HNIBRBA4712 TaxID=3373087 RepID=UPI003746A859
MSKYAQVASKAAAKCRAGALANDAWGESAQEIFPDQEASRKKGCPRSAFLGLVEEGMIREVEAGKHLRSNVNKQHALDAVKLLKAEPGLAQSPAQLWQRVIYPTPKKYNQQMHVVVALWENGDIV